MNDLAILVLSCDKYSGLWDLFFSRFHKFWGDCKLPLYLLSNHKIFKSKKVVTICTGEDKDWSSNLIYALNKIDAENILIMIEDAPLDGFVSDLDFLALYDRYVMESMNYLNLKALPLPPKGIDPQLGIIPQGAHYRASLVMAIWNKEVLLDLLVVGESAWQFEVRGSERADKYNNFYSVRIKFFTWIHCVIQGKLDLRAASALKNSGELDTVDFPKMTISQYCHARYLEFRGSIVNIIIPFRWRRRVRNFYFRKFKKNSKLV